MQKVSKYGWLRRWRVAVSVVIAIVTGIAVAIGADIWLSRWQIVPALLAASGGWLLMWIAVTLMWGRAYCSWACPMGTVQDVAARLRRRRNGYFFHPELRRMRLSALALTILCSLFGFPIVLTLADPATAFSRISTMLVSPWFRPMAISAGGALVAVATIAICGIAAWKRGRLLCNTICPVGTLLGEASRKAVYRMTIDTDVCMGCGLCTARCKAECIDPSTLTVDASRCVVCMDCAADCPTGAIRMRRMSHKVRMPMLEPVEAAPEATAMDSGVIRMDRRAFMAAIAGFAASGATATSQLKPLNYVRPPGSRLHRGAEALCTGCGICMAACPEGIIKPSTGQLGIRRSLAPILEFESGFCRYDCVRCTEVCPTGALTRLTPTEKHRTVIGKATLTASRCIEYTEGQSCGLCVRRCPTKAVRIVPVAGGRRSPVVNFDGCIGCGACAYVCPTSAYTIEGE